MPVKSLQLMGMHKMNMFHRLPRLIFIGGVTYENALVSSSLDLTIWLLERFTYLQELI